MALNSRKANHNITIGKLPLGSSYPIRIQTMTNTHTAEIKATVEQCKRLYLAGSELIRITVPSTAEIPALRAIKDTLRSEGIDTPLVADVHFFPEVALAAAEIVEKVRINPGNFTDKRKPNSAGYNDAEYQNALENMAFCAKPLIEKCKRTGAAIRIGVNHGSLCDRIISRYGNTPLAMAKSAMEWIEICENENFTKLVFSLKSSNVKTMIEANLLLTEMMHEKRSAYPLHLGVTEAANGLEGRVKSAVGIGALLLDGLGDTIRISLTEDPENEILYAKNFIDALNNYRKTDFHCEENTLYADSQEKNIEKWWGITSAVAGNLYLHNQLKDVKINNPNFSKKENEDLQNAILQACRIKMSKTEIIACPSCGRTQYDIQGVLAKVRERFSHYPNLKIAVMGCVVNGPGEMADADFGVIGSANGNIGVYQDGKRISPFLPINEAFTFLEKAIGSHLA